MFSAVRPEIKRFRETSFPSEDPYHGFYRVFDLAFQSTEAAGNIPDHDYEEVWKNMGKNRTEIRYAHWFFYFSLFSSACPDPYYGQRISEKLFNGKSFYDHFEIEMRRNGIPRPDHLPSMRQVNLGAFRISSELGTSYRNFSNPDLKPITHFEGPEPNVLSALHWRSGLTGLYGRDTEHQRLLEWALDGEKKPKLLVVSGPGGVGKSRLVAGVVSTLIHRHGWTGGLLPKMVNDSDVFSAGGKGVAVVIDYPEERSDLVKSVLKAVAD